MNWNQVNIKYKPFVFNILSNLSFVVLSPLQRLLPLELLSTLGATEIHLVVVKPRVVKHVLLRCETTAACVAYPRLLSGVNLLANIRAVE